MNRYAQGIKVTSRPDPLFLFFFLVFRFVFFRIPVPDCMLWTSPLQISYRGLCSHSYSYFMIYAEYP